MPVRRSLLATAAALALVACSTDAPSAEVGSGASPLTVRKRTPEYVVDVVRAYPHDTTAFTQGLVWHDGALYEGTGVIGRSSIRRVELTTGEVQQKRDVPAPHFGEGIVILGDRLYQLTWQSKQAFVYDAGPSRPWPTSATRAKGGGSPPMGRSST
jgi:glutaminyl-peptide cyclotransferase